METRKKNARRTKDQIREANNFKIAHHEKCIAMLELANKRLDDPPKERKPRAMSVNKALAQVKAAGYTVEELIRIANERREAAAV